MTSNDGRVNMSGKKKKIACNLQVIGVVKTVLHSKLFEWKHGNLFNNLYTNQNRNVKMKHE